MRNLITIINLAILFGITSIFSRPDKADQGSAEESGTAANELLNKPAEIGTIQSNFTVWPVQWSGDEEGESMEDSKEELASFINEMVEAKLLDIEHNKLATQRATKRSLKDYAESMVKVQTAMRVELNALAVKKKISPKDLAEATVTDVDVFKDVHGVSFDKKFISNVIKNHKRNVKKLERATRSKDAEVQVFATKYLPVVQSQWNQIKEIKKTY